MAKIAPSRIPALTVYAWAVFVAIERHPRQAARLRELEQIVNEAVTDPAEATGVGRPIDREGGLREFDILGGRGFINFLAVPRHECVYVCDITWYV